MIGGHKVPPPRGNRWFKTLGGYRVNLVENTRQLLTEEIINRMYPSEVLSRINEETRTVEPSNDFIS